MPQIFIDHQCGEYCTTSTYCSTSTTCCFTKKCILLSVYTALITKNILSPKTTESVLIWNDIKINERKIQNFSV